MTLARGKIVTAARWGIAHEPQIHYGQIRPIPLSRSLPLTTDCSGFVTLWPHSDDGGDEEWIVHVAAVERITLRAAEEREPFGFTLPDP